MDAESDLAAVPKLDEGSDVIDLVECLVYEVPPRSPVLLHHAIRICYRYLMLRDGDSHSAFSRMERILAHARPGKGSTVLRREVAIMLATEPTRSRPMCLDQLDAGHLTRTEVQSTGPTAIVGLARTHSLGESAGYSPGDASARTPPEEVCATTAAPAAPFTRSRTTWNTT